MKRLWEFLLLAGLAVSTVIASAGPSRASWVSEHCNDNQAADSYVRRTDARAYAIVAFEEGYEWGGGC
jgi:hypothetical protein